jgi:hypothetical protein
VSGIQMMLLGSYVAPVSSNVTSNYIGTAGSVSANTTVYTFNGASIGTAASDRIVFIAVSATGNSSINVSSVTIGGVSATLINTGNASFGTIGNAYLNVTSGTTANIVVTFTTGGQDRCSIDVYTIYGSTATPYDTALTLQPSSASTISTNVDIPTGAVCIYSFVAPAATITSSYSSAT